MSSDRLLAVDVGNTNVVLGLWEGDTLRNAWRLTTLRDRTADEYGILAKQLLGETADGVDAAVVASVVPPLNGTIAAMLRRTFAVEPLFVEPGIKTGLSVRTEGDPRAALVKSLMRVRNAPESGQVPVLDSGHRIAADAIVPRTPFRRGHS